MHIAIYHSLLCSRGGPEKAVLRYIQNTEHEVSLYTLQYDREKTFDGFKDVRIVNIGGEEDYSSQSLDYKHIANHIDFSLYDRLIISNKGSESLVAVRNNSVPIVNLCHKPSELQNNSLLDKTRNYFQTKSWGQFDQTVFTSEEVKKQVEQSELDVGERRLIEPGADTDKSIPGNYDQYFFYPTSFDTDQNIEQALDAFEKFQNWNPQKEYGFIIAGAVTDQNKDSFDKLKNRIKDIDSAEYRTGFSDEEYREMYRNSYAVVHTAEESYGDLTALEAGSYGKPVVATNSSGVEEFIVDGETGYLAYSEPKYVAEAMDELANKPEKVSEMGKNAVQHANQYSWKKFAEEIDSVVENV